MKRVLYKEKEYIECMSTVGCSASENFCVVVNPDGNRRGIVYFKYCNASSYSRSSRIIRIMLDKCEYVFHKNKKGKYTWKLNSKDKRKLQAFMSSKNKSFPLATNYQVACFFWNREMGLLDMPEYPANVYYSQLDAYVCGWFDNKQCSINPSYISSAVCMPDYTQLPSIK